MALSVDRRRFLASLPAVLAAHRLMAQGGPPQIRVNGLSQLTLTVSDPKRSIDFYQGLFGMPVQARQGTTTYLRIGAGPRFLAIMPAAPGERPSISRFGMGVEQFDVDSILKVLAQHGVTPEEGADAASPKVGPMKVRVVTRGNTREMFVGDPAGIVFQLHDASYCGGSGPLGNMCQPEPAPTKGLLAVKDMSHFTISAPSAQFYPALFGMPVQAMQATTPAYGVGPGVHFLMFTGGGGGGRGAAPGEGAPAAGRGGAPAAGGRGSGAPANPTIDHACLGMDGFVPEAVTKTLTGFGIKPGARSDGALVTYISLRMENRGGAPVTGTPELYFTDPDGLAIQLQDTKYCGGGGYLGDICPG
ncbi:MAG TPA: VOC family protein [Vicinamibacterales bacterium]|nr:VOC family protein [Vicinamibacterales bacterium]